MNSTAIQRGLADKAFAAYDFGDDIVEDYDEWSDEGDGELSRVFYLVEDEGDTRREVFIVRFSADGSAVAEAFMR